MKLLNLLFAVFLSCTLYGQVGCKPVENIDEQLTFFNFDLSSGISNSYINSIAQDESGLIWVGTIDGLNRYDGHDFKVYRRRNTDTTSLYNNYVEKITSQGNGDLLVLTDDGLDFYSAETDSFKKARAFDQPSDNLRVVVKGADGTFYVGYSNSGVHVFDSDYKEQAAYRHQPGNPESLSNNEVSSMLIQADSILWVGTYRKGLNRIDLKEKTVTRVYFEELPKNQEQAGVQALHLDEDQNLWIGSQNGLFVLRNDGVIRALGTGPKAALSDEEILCFEEDNQGRMWIGTRNGGLNILNMKSFIEDRGQPQVLQYLPRRDGSSVFNRSVSALKLDRGGNMWIGTSNGLNFVNPKGEPIKLINEESSVRGLLSHDRIASLANSRDGNVYIGTDGGGIDLYNASTGKIKAFASSDKSGLSNDYVLALREDSKGRLWAGTYKGGLNKLQNGNWSHYLQESQAVGNDVRAIFEDTSKNIWVGTNRGGLYKYNEEKDAFEDVEILGKLDIRAIAQDKQGNFWMATYGDGILKYNPLTRQHVFYNSQRLRGLPSDIFFSLILLNDHDLLAGSRFGGLVHFDTRKMSFDVINEEDGLPNTTVNSIVNYTDEEVWLSTNNGLSSYNLKSRKLVNLLDPRAVQKSEFNIGASLKDQRGNLWFGGNKGLNIFNPKNLSGEVKQYGIVFQDLSVNNKPVSIQPHLKDALLTKSLNDLEALKISYREKLFSLHFTLVKYPFSQDVRYAYLLKGYSNNWVELGTTGLINFTNLPSGKYNLIIRATEQSGTVTTRELPLTIVPPFWLTMPAYLLYFTIAVVLIYLGFKYYSERLKLKNSLLFEKRQRKLEHDFNEERMRFYSGFSHELKTPLTLILAPLEILAQELKTTRHNARVDLIKKNAAELLASINRLLDFRKTEEGLSTLHVQTYNLVEVLEEWLQLHANAAELKNINLRFKADVTHLDVTNDIDKLQIIFNNLMSNALKYTLDDGSVMVNLSVQENMYRIAVQDSGVGILPEEFEHIFNWFYHSNSTVKRNGSGIGLSLSRRFAELHEGNLTVESKPGEGSIFTIEVPFDLSQIAPEKIRYTSTEISSEKQREGPTAYVREFNIKTYDKKAILNGDKERELILLVEDNPDILTLLDDILSEHYDLLHAENGEVGIAMAGKFSPDLIITDVMMPVKDGIDLCHELKSNSGTSHIPIIMLSAKTDTAVKVSGFKEGADDYLTKPFEPQLIKARVRNLLDSRLLLQNYFKGAGSKEELSSTETRVLDKEKAFLADFEQAVLKFKDSEGSIILKLTRELGMSRTSLYKKITVLTGENINSYVRIIKVNKASQLMSEEGYSVSEAAAAVGFNSPKYFRKIFKEQFGKLPSEFTTSFHKLL
ncbi:hybrid sensor histidine kinase/response regulator transcription factor [Leeuwenhoekiella sp. W20_SRS_FM14]|uniref:hybrid sensor histidine kinase/response regulator transcription factor n=1 Tax=Leeuwenhoekiella sp. W20_SRS_FM14 TaxID=3240270 RepID=UPI003F95F375